MTPLPFACCATHMGRCTGELMFVSEMIPLADALCDLHLLAVTGGRDRTRSEHAALLELAGFAFVARRLPGVPAVIAGEARRGSEVYGPQPVISKESRAVRS